MQKTTLLLAALFTCVVCAEATAGKYNAKLSIGDEAPVWKDLPGVDDKQHSLGDLKDKKAIVVVYTCNSCPYAVDIEDRLIAISKEYAGKGVAIVAINVNKIEDDALPAMKDKAQKKKFPFLYLYDESQQIAKDFGAVYTPDFYVLDQNRKVAYMGSLDDSPNGKAITKTYVKDAVDAVLAGKKVSVAETPPVGCRVRYERERRTRTAK